MLTVSYSVTVFLHSDKVDLLDLCSEGGLRWQLGCLHRRPFLFSDLQRSMSTLRMVGVSCIDRGRAEEEGTCSLGCSWRTLTVEWSVEDHMQGDISFTWRSVAGCFPAKGTQV